MPVGLDEGIALLTRERIRLETDARISAQTARSWIHRCVREGHRRCPEALEHVIRARSSRLEAKLLEARRLKANGVRKLILEKLLKVKAKNPKNFKKFLGMVQSADPSLSTSAILYFAHERTKKGKK
jgi:hypothetical protein